MVLVGLFWLLLVQDSFSYFSIVVAGSEWFSIVLYGDGAGLFQTAEVGSGLTSGFFSRVFASSSSWLMVMVSSSLP